MKILMPDDDSVAWLPLRATYLMEGNFIAV